MGVLILDELCDDFEKMLEGISMDKREHLESATSLFHERPCTLDEVALSFSLKPHARRIVMPECPWTHDWLFPFYLLMVTNILVHQYHPREKTMAMNGLPMIVAADFHNLGEVIEIVGGILPEFRGRIADYLFELNIKFELIEKAFSLMFDEDLQSPLNDVISMTFVTGLSQY